MSRRRIDKDGLIEEFQENRRDEGPQDSPARRSLTASDKNIVEQMFIGLVIEGIADFAPYLARSFAQGYGVKQNEFLSNLTGSIGKKLNNDNTIEKSPIEEIAQECVKQIKANAEIYGSKEIPLKEVLQVVVQFDAQVKKMSAEMVEAPGSSYIESIDTVIMRQVAQDSVKQLEFEEKEESSLDDTQNEQLQKELAEQQRLKTLEEEQQRQKELAEQQRLQEQAKKQAAQHQKEQEEQAEAARKEEAASTHHIQLAKSPIKTDYGSFPENSDYFIDIIPSTNANTPLLLPPQLPSGHVVNLGGQTSEQNDNDGCCPKWCCCVVM